MIPLNDPRWQQYEGGYRCAPCDAALLLRRLFDSGPSRALWNDIWEALLHQGDVGRASYAAVPHLLEFARRSEKLDDNPFALLAAIELQRWLNKENPPVPPELEQSYLEAIQQAPQLLLSHPDREWDETLTRTAASCLALARGQRELALFFFEITLERAREIEIGFWPPYETGS